MSWGKIPTTTVGYAPLATITTMGGIRLVKGSISMAKNVGRLALGQGPLLEKHRLGLSRSDHSVGGVSAMASSGPNRRPRPVVPLNAPQGQKKTRLFFSRHLFFKYVGLHAEREQTPLDPSI